MSSFVPQWLSVKGSKVYRFPVMAGGYLGIFFYLDVSVISPGWDNRGSCRFRLLACTQLSYTEKHPVPGHGSPCLSSQDSRG